MNENTKRGAMRFVLAPEGMAILGGAPCVVRGAYAFPVRQSRCQRPDCGKLWPLPEGLAAGLWVDHWYPECGGALRPELPPSIRVAK